MALRVYTLHRRGPAELELIVEGFCWPAFLFGPLWLAWKHEWLGLAAWFGAALIVCGLAALTLSETGQAAVDLGFAALVGFAANDWRRWRLERAGWRLADLVAARSLREAEDRLLDEGRLAAPPIPPPPVPATPWPRLGAAPADPFLP
jgi:hypothetical protein